LTHDALRIGVEKNNKGKRGGARVIYYYHDENILLALLAIYAKGEKIDLTPHEKKELKKLVADYGVQAIP
jgi:mRNA-degrading endonuclease RelE of RelBE toxin-antitoxin system